MGPSTLRTSRGGMLGRSCRASVSLLVKLSVASLPAFKCAQFNIDCLGERTEAVVTFLMGPLLWILPAV